MAEQTTTTDTETTEAPNPLQAQVDKLTGEGQKYHKRAQDAEAANVELTARLDKIEADNKNAAEAAEQADLVKKGDFDTALEKQKASMLDDKGKETTRADNAESQLRQIFGTDALKTELGAQGVKPELIDQAAQLLRSRVKVDLSDGKPSVTVMDSDGNPAFVEGNAADIKSLVGSWLPDNKHFLPPSGDGGTGLHQGGTPGENAGLTQAGLLANPQKHADFIAQYKTSAESSAAFAKLPPEKEK